MRERRQAQQNRVGPDLPIAHHVARVRQQRIVEGIEHIEGGAIGRIDEFVVDEQLGLARAQRQGLQLAVQVLGHAFAKPDLLDEVRSRLAGRPFWHLTKTAERLVWEARFAVGDVLVFGGGVIPDADARALREQGVAEIFGPGSSLKGISAWLERELDQRED